MDTQFYLVIYALFLSVCLGIAVQHILELKELVKSDKELLDIKRQVIAEQEEYIALQKELINYFKKIISRHREPKHF